MTEVRGKTVQVRPLLPGELPEAVRLHERELPHEFLTRFGTKFLVGYYGAFLESPYATALGAFDAQSGKMCGVLIGAFEVREHYAYLVRRHALVLGAYGILRALRSPGLAVDLVRTRLSRYVRGIVRLLVRGRAPETESERVGLLTYVAVDRERRGHGIGGSLVRAFEEMARRADLERLELVTLYGERGAGRFYERMGWTYGGERISRSGEKYALYTRSLRS